MKTILKYAGFLAVVLFNLNATAKTGNVLVTGKRLIKEFDETVSTSKPFFQTFDNQKVSVTPTSSETGFGGIVNAVDVDEEGRVIQYSFGLPESLSLPSRVMFSEPLRKHSLSSRTMPITIEREFLLARSKKGQDPNVLAVSQTFGTKTIKGKSYRTVYEMTFRRGKPANAGKNEKNVGEFLQVSFVGRSIYVNSFKNSRQSGSIVMTDNIGGSFRLPNTIENEDIIDVGINNLGTEVRVTMANGDTYLYIVEKNNDSLQITKSNKTLKKDPKEINAMVAALNVFPARRSSAEVMGLDTKSSQ